MNQAMTKTSDNTAVEEVGKATVKPRCDIYESADQYLVLADLPGVTTDELRLDLDADRLTLATRRATGVDYMRTFSIPREIDRDKVSARLEAGVLHLELPKSAAVKPRQIAVTAG